MNGIHKYLAEVAIQSIRKAAGKIISTEEIDPITVATSLNELINEIEKLKQSKHLKTTCELDYKGGWESTRPNLSDTNVNPIFIKPTQNKSS